MIDTRLDDILHNRGENYLLPFYWQRGSATDKIPEQIARIEASGCRAICIESRTHEDFCKDGWWRDMDIVFAECEKRGMKVWILDDKHYPTGNANGMLIEKYPHLRQLLVIERHLDVLGPMEGASVLVPPPEEEDVLIGIYAYKRSPDGGEGIIGEPVNLTDAVTKNILAWDIPEGCWRIFFIFKTHRGGRDEAIDPISAESSAVMLEAVYEPHYERYKKYFGNVFAGFFSDEPRNGNYLIGRFHTDPNRYHYGIGQEGLALPYNEKLLALMSKTLGKDALQLFGELWYDSPTASQTRFAYMDAMTELYRDSFSLPIGNWCRSHGVEYIGHIIEDMNAHGRMGYGPGHYFRSLMGQDMSGIDIVLHQVMPGFAHYVNAASCMGGSVDSEFFHYSLGQLAASLAHQAKHMRGRAMCEVFGAYGWAEGAPMMRWLIDFLLVRGVNHFVPHAFSPDYPDKDCPPHFGAEGHDPQFDGFTSLMGYSNKMAHILYGGRHIATAAVLYHAEGEWMSGVGNAMLMQVPARALLDNQIDYDFVCRDTILNDAKVENRRLCIGDETFGALVIPGSPFLPTDLCAKIAEFQEKGLPVFIVGEVPSGINAQATKLDDLANAVGGVAGRDIELESPFPLLRFYHIKRDGNDIFFFFNESFADTVSTRIKLPCNGDFARLRLLEDVAVSDSTDDGWISLELRQGQSELFVFGSDASLPRITELRQVASFKPEFSLELASSENLECFKPYAKGCELFNVNGPKYLPEFCGKMRYSFTIDTPAELVGKSAVIDLGRVGQTARLWINGQNAGIRIDAPYRFKVGDWLKAGANDIVVEVSNTLAQKERDRFSYFVQIPPSGLLGPISLLS